MSQENPAFALLNNQISHVFCRGVFLVSNRCHVIGRQHLPEKHDGLLVACTHLSHYDPFCISVLAGRRIDWMARVESFQTPVSEWLTRNSAGFAIDRFGLALPGIRAALERLRGGRIVGIFPEGEVMDENTSALTHGELKAGVGLLARRADVPVVPCVALNSQQFSRVTPWLPFRAGRLYVAFGPPLFADPDLPPGRESRWELTNRLRPALRELYSQLQETFEIPDSAGPRKVGSQPAPAAALDAGS